MKWAFLIIALAGALPLAGWLRRTPRAIPIIWMLVGFLALEQGPIHLYMAFNTWAGQWPGALDGAEISLLDLIILAIYLSLPRGRHSLPFKFSMAFYFIATLLSVFQASAPIAALFYCWQLVRVFFVFTVVTKACADDPNVVPSLLKGIAAGLFLTICQAVWQRFGLGILQADAGFGHQNIVGVISHFVAFPFFALLLAGERGWITKTASLAGILLAVFTTSRGAIALAGFGYVALFILSALRQWTSRKAMIAVTGVIVFGVLAPFVVSSFAQRFNIDRDDFFELDKARVSMSQAASMILSDHPMGIGANHYVVIANTQGYDERVGVDWINGAVPVHNIYWLVAAETGYLGIITFVIMLLRPLAVAFLCGWRNRRDQRGDLLLGFGVALLLVYVHSFYEFVFIFAEVQYMFAVTAGMIAGLAQQLGYWSRTHAIQIESSDLARPVANAAKNFRIETNY